MSLAAHDSSWRQRADEGLDRFFAHYYERRPVNATFTGVHDHDGQLPDWSLAGLEQTLQEMAELRRDFASVQVPECLDGAHSREERIAIADVLLADGFLEIQEAELEGAHFQRRNPALFTGEAVFAILSLMLRDFAPAAMRAEAIEKRLRGIPHLLAAARLTIGERLVPESWIARAATECDGALAAFGRGLDEWCRASELTHVHVERLEAAAGRAMSAVSEFGTWLRSLRQAEPGQSGCGPELFDLLLQRGHWERRTRANLLTEIHEQFTEAEARLREMGSAAHPDGWPGVASRLADRHPTASDYLDSYQRTWEACRAMAVAHDLVTWPQYPIRYVPIPAWARMAAPHLYFLHYRAPAPYDQPNVVDYLVAPVDELRDPEAMESALRATNHSVIKLNHVVHHGALGHHVQNFYAYRSLSRIGRVAAVDCASRIGMFCGGSMAEGWACYATDLMGEAGFLDELELVAEQHSRLRQLARAIVDIELHQHTMDERGARRLYEERVGMSGTAAAKEVTRNSMFPGASIMYWLGTQEIHDLRASIQRAKGDAFSMREFHDTLLSHGSIPVPLIAELMSGEAAA